MKTSHVIRRLGASVVVAALAFVACEDEGTAPGEQSGFGGQITGGAAPGGIAGSGGTAAGSGPMTGSAGGAVADGGSTAPIGGSAGVGDAGAVPIGTSLGGSGASAGGSGGVTGSAGGTAGAVTADAGANDAGTAVGHSDAATGDADAGGSLSLPTGPNSIAYIGCSMANNIGTGYKRVGGKVMWNADNYQTGGMVVQNWTSSTSSSWGLFDQKMQAIGGKDKVKAIMVQICVFSSRATDDEVKSMIAAARAHTNPGTHIYLVGQPQYELGHECILAGTGGAKWTDDEAKKIAADASVNQDLTYLGTFTLDSTKGEVSFDTCHASTSGEDVMGRQAMAFFGG